VSNNKWLESNEVPCVTCGKPTSDLGTKRCDRCWEIHWRIEQDPKLALKVLQEFKLKLPEHELFKQWGKERAVLVRQIRKLTKKVECLQDRIKSLHLKMKGLKATML
jgi:hypothetical protein